MRRPEQADAANPLLILGASQFEESTEFSVLRNQLVSLSIESFLLQAKSELETLLEFCAGEAYCSLQAEN